jgi:plasmid maintenance system antidote protein VapI
LAARGLSAAALALKLRIAPQRVQEIVAGKRMTSG